VALTGAVNSLDPASEVPVAHPATIRDSKKSFYAEVMSTQGPGPFFSDLNFVVHAGLKNAATAADTAALLLGPQGPCAWTERGLEQSVSIHNLLLLLQDSPQSRGFWISINRKSNPPKASFRAGWEEGLRNPDDPSDPAGSGYNLDVSAQPQFEEGIDAASFHGGTVTFGFGTEGADSLAIIDNRALPNFGVLRCARTDPNDVVVATVVNNN
jgi:hypothetical protein